MYSRDREELYMQSKRHMIWSRIKNGWFSMYYSTKRIIIFFGILFANLQATTVLQNAAAGQEDLVDRVVYLSWSIVLIVLIPFIAMAILYIFGYPKNALKTDMMMKRISIRNSAGESPILINYHSIDGTNTKVYEFDSYGIPVSSYEESISEIEAALNVNVVKVVQGENRNRVLVYAVDFTEELGDIAWKDEALIPDESVLNLGKGYTGDVTADLNRMPHMLIGGSTGSGKSVLLKCLIYQCAVKGAEVIIADFKGGLDYNGRWKTLVNVITDMDTLIDKLKRLTDIIEERKALFHEHNALNIEEYRQITGKECKRVIFACDEVAEFLDKTGLSKEAKEKVSTAESMMATIARMGRAFGVNMLLATQRPDANILSGQIRNNIDYRVCGRADDVLSKIVLDNTEASERIPKWEQGMFLNNEGIVFRAYNFRESDIGNLKRQPEYMI